MFELKNHNNYGDAGSGKWLVLNYNGKRQCVIKHWTLYCCGLASFEEFSYYSGVFKDKKTLDALLEFLKTAWHGDQWKPKEYLFAMSDTQLKNENLQALVKHKRVKRLDSFENKAHGPNKVHLFRLSIENDFPGRKRVK